MYFILCFKGLDKIPKIADIIVFDAEVIDDEGEGKRTDGVGKEAGDIGVLEEIVFSKMCDEINVRSAASKGVTIHGTIDTTQYMLINDEFSEIVLLEKSSGNVCDRDSDPFGLGQCAH